MLLVDTNVFLAASDRRSARHGDCAALLRAHRHELATSVPVIAESSWLILDRLGDRSHAEFLRNVTSGRLEAVELTTLDWQRCRELVERYADMHLDLMDASLIAVAERLGLKTAATLDRRDFTVVRPRHTDAFELIP